MKNKYFKFYEVYLNELNKLRPSQFKKVVNALSEYSSNEILPEKLKGKSLSIFNKIQTVLIAEKMELKNIENKRKAGIKGSQKRWQNDKTRQNYNRK